MPDKPRTPGNRKEYSRISSESTAATQKWWLKPVANILALPRILRIVISAVFALALVLVIFPFIDWVYYTYFFSMETRGVPAYIIAACGLVMYLVGWRTIVGTHGEKLSPRRWTGWYLISGLILVVIAAILIAYGLILRGAIIEG